MTIYNSSMTALLSVCLVVSSMTAHPVSACMSYSTASQIDLARHVVDVRVISRTLLAPDELPSEMQSKVMLVPMAGFNSFAGARYLLRVTRSIKGDPGMLLTVIDTNASRSVGSDHILFISARDAAEAEKHPLRPLTTDECGSYLLQNSAEIVLDIGRATGQAVVPSFKPNTNAQD